MDYGYDRSRYDIQLRQWFCSIRPFGRLRESWFVIVDLSRPECECQANMKFATIDNAIMWINSGDINHVSWLPLYFPEMESL